MNGKAGAISLIMVVCLALVAILKSQVEQIRVAATAMGFKDLESARLCVSMVHDICTFGILTFRFAEFDVSVICYAVFILV